MGTPGHAAPSSGHRWLLGSSIVVGIVLVSAVTLVSVRALRHASTVVARSATSAPPTSPPATGTPSVTPTKPPQPTGPFAVGLRTVTFVDHSRLVYPPHTRTGKPGPRVLHTYVWYPAQGPAGTAPLRGAVPASAAGPYPLVVSAHGFALGPLSYAWMLEWWARAGYVVAAPAFPLTNPNAIGGLNERDMPNQPGDVSFVISQMIASSRTSGSFLSGLIEPSRIGVAGQSDGGDTVLASAYGSCCRDPRVDAAIVMAGQAMPFGGRFFGASKTPPLLVIQGSADTVNAPAFSTQIYGMGRPPKYLLWLKGADHLQPFAQRDPYAALVRKVSLEFLDEYLKALPHATTALPASSGGLASMRRDAPRPAPTG